MSGEERVSEAQVNPASPVLRINRYEDALRFDRDRAILNAAEMFAAVAADPVNGEINVSEFLEGSVVFMNGPEHRDRRKLLNTLLRPDALRAIREDVILPAAERLLATRLAHPDEDGAHRMDLVEFCHRVFLHFTAQLIGLVGADTEDGIAALSDCAGPIAAGTSSQFRRTGRPSTRWPWPPSGATSRSSTGRRAGPTRNSWPRWSGVSCRRTSCPSTS
jgi:cytochrome P450